VGICEVPVGVHNGHLKHEKHNMAKLTNEQARAVRASTESDQTLARRYKVHYSTIWLIRANRTWRGLEGD
jgi:hypothetical protein